MIKTASFTGGIIGLSVQIEEKNQIYDEVTVFAGALADS
jgi:hypothetical protein